MKIRSEHAVEKLELLLQKMVQDGELRAGERLPSQAELARKFGVCRNTVSAAVGRLACRGLVVTRVGVGTEAVELLRAIDLKMLLGLARSRSDRAPALQVLEQVIRVVRCVLVQAAVDAAERAAKVHLVYLDQAAGQVSAHRGNARLARRAEYQFWRVIAGASGNVAVTAALNSTRALWTQEWPLASGGRCCDAEALATVARAVRTRQPQLAAIAANAALRDLAATSEPEPTPVEGARVPAPEAAPPGSTEPTGAGPDEDSPQGAAEQLSG